MATWLKLCRWSVYWVGVLGTSWACAGGLTQLQAFLSQTRSGDVRFEQTVSRDAPGAKPAPSVPQKLSGRMRFIRPDRFRFDYEKPYAQTIVGDGRKLWLYDPELAQVTVRNQAQALADSPASLIAVANGLEALKAHFVLSEAPDSEGLSWVIAEPKNAEAMLTQVRMGLSGSALRVLDMTDALGQHTRLTFSAKGLGQAVAADVFRFVPGQGVDVVNQ